MIRRILMVALFFTFYCVQGAQFVKQFEIMQMSHDDLETIDTSSNTYDIKDNRGRIRIDFTAFDNVCVIDCVFDACLSLKLSIAMFSSFLAL